ncbi:actin depolymerising venom protein gelsolin 1 [Aethina tumida]|uniref:actin depolymerising venom protein gelsolin 1 n=1 Tax=Aethina tumida TaxID=116153 RepID=UPI0021477C5B|nr:actin depolymerising venom protein gelsolin 1 [Aethina tumida]
MSIMFRQARRLDASRRFVKLFAILVLIVGFESSSAATTYKRPGQFSSPDPKRQKAGSTIMDPAFANAGKEAGLEIWRIEDFKPVRYPKSDYGKFYTGDSYIVLFTKINKNKQKSWDIHFWLGSETSQDEAGSAAILTVQLDEQLGGDPVEYREVQEHESQLFLSHFKNGVRYLPGGVQSGFHHVDRNAYEKRLFQVKGSRNIRVKQVSPSIASMNKGDCFILDVGSDIYVYVGQKAKRVEKLKAIGAASQIRDQDHAGKGKITIVDEFSPQSDFDNFFKALGEGSQATVPEESVGGDDQQFESNEERVVTLYRVSDASGSLKVTPVGQKPLVQSALDTNDCFILDTVDANIFVWVGKKCNAKEKGEAIKKAENYMTSKKYPKWTHIQRLVEGAETTPFTQYFKTWRAFGERSDRLVRSASNDVDADWEPRLFHAEIRTKGGKFRIEEVHNFEQKDLNEDDVMVLDNGLELFVWIGNGASPEEKEQSETLVEKYLKELGRDGVKAVTVAQGDEPESFKQVFPSWDAKLWDNVPHYRDLVQN